MTFTPSEEMIRAAEAEFASFETERQFGLAPDIGQHWLDRERNRLLRESLETASKADQWIEPEQARIRILLEQALEKPDSPERQKEIEAREYQIWYVERYLTRAADIAQTRLAYFREIKTAEDIATEQALCSSNLEHWFRFYAWGYDPRARTPLSVVPFELYPRQLELVNTLEDIVFHRKTSLAIEKARDEGATELIVRWGVHRWNYREGFSMLMSSRTEDEVDTKKKQGTLFERARFQIRRLPNWMLHPEFDVGKGLLPDKIIANANGNAIHGQAPTQDMGRGDRVTCAMLDEFAFWRFAGYPQYTALSQTTDSILMPSSVAGIFNQFADLTHDGVTEKFEMDWRDNPFKDKRWYNSLPFGYIAPKMTRTAIAQEVDRNYRASQPGKVWQCPEPYVFITWSEFLRPFIAKGLGHKFTEGGRDTIPGDWSITRTNDFGKSDGHDWAHLVGGQPKQGYGLEDTHFIFVARNLEPTGLMIEQAVALWREWEAGLGLRDRKTYKWTHKVPPRNWNSHEQAELRDVLLQTYGENWTAWDTDYETGITTIEDWWTVIDKHEENPFRPELMGRCRLVFVAADDEYELAFNERLNEWFVTTSVTEAGFSLARKQIDAYHYSQSELGKPVKKMRPVKEFDDLVDCLTALNTILTQRGQVPIPEVTTGDWVMTRQGWRPVMQSRQTAQQVSTYTLTDAEGRSITGTGNHRIWTQNRGWVPLRRLHSGDILLTWQSAEALTPRFVSSMARRFIDTLMPSRLPIDAISPRSSMPAVEVFRLFISKCGSFIMDPFRRAGTSIIRAGTSTIMTFLTWNAFPLNITGPSTGKNEAVIQGDRNGLPTWIRSEKRPPLGTDLPRGGRGMSYTPENLRQNGHLSRRFASIVGMASQPSTASRLPAPQPATPPTAIKSPVSRPLPWLRTALDAVSRFLSLETPKAERPPCIARPVAVRSLVKNVERQSVYNLNVADQHEYFANGILVANCIRGYSVNWNREPIQYTKAEAREAALPENIRNIETIIATMPQDQAERAMVARTMAFQTMDEKDAHRRAAMAKVRPQVPRIGMRNRR